MAGLTRVEGGLATSLEQTASLPPCAARPALGDKVTL